MHNALTLELNIDMKRNRVLKFKKKPDYLGKFVFIIYILFLA